MPLHVEVVSPESILYEGEAEQVVCRPTGGEIAFLPGHQPFVGALETYPVRVIIPTGEVMIAVHGGFVEVRDDHVTVLSDVAELPEQIDVVRAQTAKETAEAAVRANADDLDAAAALARAELRLQVAGAATTAAAHRGYVTSFRTWPHGPGHGATLRSASGYSSAVSPLRSSGASTWTLICARVT